MSNKVRATDPGLMAVMLVNVISRVCGMPEEGLNGLKESLQAHGLLPGKEDKHPMAVAQEIINKSRGIYIPDGAQASIDNVSPGKQVAEYKPATEIEKNKTSAGRA